MDNSFNSEIQLWNKKKQSSKQYNDDYDYDENYKRLIGFHQYTKVPHSGTKNLNAKDFNIQVNYNHHHHHHDYHHGDIK